VGIKANARPPTLWLSLLAAVLDSEDEGLVNVEDNAGFVLSLTCVSHFTHIYCVGDTRL
jgi:hypothetical protein